MMNFVELPSSDRLFLCQAAMAEVLHCEGVFVRLIACNSKTTVLDWKDKSLRWKEHAILRAYEAANVLRIEARY